MRQRIALASKDVPVYPSLADAIKARFEAGHLSWQAAASLAIRGSQSVPGGISWRSDPQLTLTSPLYLTEEQVLAFLNRIQAPTQLILGESGDLVKREFMTERYARVAQLEITALAGGHHVHLEDPVATARVLAPFFNP
jgi:pimeloyl-ACP methyl ester carboxylesterase